MAGILAPLAILAGVGVGRALRSAGTACSPPISLSRPFIVTLGTMTFLRGMAYTITEGQPIVSSSLSFRELGNGYLAGIPVPVIMLVVYLLAWFILGARGSGIVIFYAVGGNAQAAPAGVRVKRVLAAVYMIAGVCAGLAGHYLRRPGHFRPAYGGTGYELDAITGGSAGRHQPRRRTRANIGTLIDRYSRRAQHRPDSAERPLFSPSYWI